MPRQRSVRSRLFFLVVLFGVVMAATFIGVSTVVVVNNVTVQVEQSLALETGKTQSKIADYFSKVRQVVGLLSEEPGFVAPDRTSSTRAQLKALLERNRRGFDFLFVYFGIEADGTAINYDAPPGWDARKRPWYQTAVKEGKLAITEPYVDAATGVLVTTVVQQIDGPSGRVGVLAIDCSLQDIVELVFSKNELFASAFNLIVSADGRVLIAQDPALLGAPFPVEAWKEGSPIRRVDFQGQARVASIQLDSETGYYVVSLLSPDEITAPAIRLLLLLLAIIVVVLGIFIAILNRIMGGLISRPITQIAQDMKTIGGGDLTCAVDPSLLARQDEIGQLARAVLDMQTQLHTLTLAVRNNAVGVQEGAHDIVGSVDEQAASTNQMSAAVAEITSTMEELSASSTQIAEYSRSVVDIANVTWENSKKGSQAMVLLLEKIKGIRADNELSLQEIIDLGRKSKEISKVMAIINVVADQTKLIAFNAALEASSAGEAGKRFGVVAAEIRRLADSVTESTGEIESRIGEIQDSISRLVITSEKGSVGIAEGMSASTLTSGLLDDLVDAASQTTSAAQQISLSTQQQKTASNQVVIALREIVASSQHTVDSIQSIARISHGMTMSARELNDLVGQFKLAPQA